jgi:hypothetical protein
LGRGKARLRSLGRATAWHFFLLGQKKMVEGNLQNSNRISPQKNPGFNARMSAMPETLPAV